MKSSSLIQLYKKIALMCAWLVCTNPIAIQAAQTAPHEATIIETHNDTLLESMSEQELIKTCNAIYEKAVQAGIVDQLPASFIFCYKYAQEQQRNESVTALQKE